MKSPILLLIALVFTAIQANSQVEYTELSQPVSIHTGVGYQIDFNNDAVIDLLLWVDWVKLGAGCQSVQTVDLFSIKPIDTAYVYLDTNESLKLFNNFDTIQETSNHILNEYFCENNDIYNCPLLLSFMYFTDFNCNPSDTIFHGPYEPFNNKYIGLKLKILENYHFAWIKVSKGTATDFTIHSYAYNLTPNEELVIYDPTSTNTETPIVDKIRCYPNPVGDFLSIDLNVNCCTIEITDLYGRVMHKRKYNNSHCNIPTFSWSKGAYIVSIITENNIVIKKVLKK